MRTIEATDFVTPQRPVVEAAGLLAIAVSGEIRAHGSVTVSLKGLRGVSSAFFNTLFADVARSSGTPALSSALKLETDSNAQREVLERSLKAVLRDLLGK